jgi:glycerol-1-phosphate dehydrogenase [NAD(P)+]
LPPADGGGGRPGRPSGSFAVIPDPIAALLAGAYRDPETGSLLACDSRAIVIEDSLAGREVELVESLKLGPRLALVADVDTYAALGQRVSRALTSRFGITEIVLPRRPHADDVTIEAISERLGEVDAVVAVGSGTINDLSKMVALAHNVPQVVFGTAPSMNGYTSVSASITEAGFKRSVRARTPVGVFLDLGVLARAPARLVRAGLGDSVCRPTAQADWLLAHLLLDRPYREVPFALLAEDEPRLFQRAGELVTDSGDLGAMRALARTLVLSGVGMTIAGGSFPASQGEHMVSHYLEMMAPPGIEHAFHGEQIGVAAIASARVQAGVLARDGVPRLRASTVTRESIVAHFGDALGDACWREFSRKQVDADLANARLATRWPDMRARLAAVATAGERIESLLKAAGAPTTAAELGYGESLWSDAVAHARETRDRYVFFDFAADSA